ncbi:cyclin-B1-2-like [Salvia divinorum]|uniref:Cyclin-B1-2-like n=1 Tax=Salvia divinorum TaxID=28513 RepID=A0ABD1I3C8_SALDI
MDPAKTIPLEGRTDDLLRFGIHGVKSDIIEPHPLQSARRSAKQTQEEMKKRILSNTYGAAFPMKMEMDRQILSKFQRPPGAVPSSFVGLEAFTGTMEEFGFEDYLNDPRESESYRPVDLHHGMEVRLGLSKGPPCPSFMSDSLLRPTRRHDPAYRPPPPLSHDTSNFSTPSAITESPNGGVNADVKPLKEKTMKAQRRAIQEAQRATKGEGSRTAGVDSANARKSVKPAPQRKDNSSVTASEKKSSGHQTYKHRKKDVPHPRMQFDDQNRVKKAKKQSLVKQAEARNIVELFRHLPQSHPSCCTLGCLPISSWRYIWWQCPVHCHVASIPRTNQGLFYNT